jgi:hypothetical protein
MPIRFCIVHNIAKIAASILLTTQIATAGPLIHAGDIRLRQDIQTLANRGIIRGLGQIGAETGGQWRVGPIPRGQHWYNPPRS